MNTVIQHIETYWTKESRGNPGATIRNSVPDTFPIGSPPETLGVFLNEIKYSEYSNFKSPTVSDFRYINENQQRQLGFKFENSSGELLVSKWNYSGHLKTIGTLKPNSWLKVVTNERVSLEYTWAYYKHVYNIYFGKAYNLSDAFSSQKPTTVLNTEKNLW